MLDRRDSTSSDYLEIAARQIRKKLYKEKEFVEASSIGAYYSTGSEVPTGQMILDALRTRDVYLPRVIDTRIMEFGQITSLDELRPGIYGVSEPKQSAANECPDVVIVPAVGASPDGSRLGYGLGYYDTFLRSHKVGTTIAIVLEKQIIRRLPTDDHDVRIDMIITEDRVIRPPR